MGAPAAGSRVQTGCPTGATHREDRCYISAPHSASLNATAVTVIAVWSGTGIKTLVAKRHASTIATTNYDFFANFNEWNGTTFNGPSDASTGFRIGLFSQDSSGFQPYKNGVAFSSYANAIGATNSEPLWIGSSMGTGEFFSGDIAEIAIFTRLLTVSERNAAHRLLSSRYALSVTLS